MSYFSQSKSEGDRKSVQGSEIRVDAGPATGKASAEFSTLGRDMLITGNIVCAGAIQILGRVVGDIHAAKLVIGEGARVEGNLTAQDTVIHGSFKGTIHSNTVKLQSTAVVEGEILKQSLAIEPNAQFEGMSRRLERPVEAPSSEQARGEKQGSTAEVVPFSGSIS